MGAPGGELGALGDHGAAAEETAESAAAAKDGALGEPGAAAEETVESAAAVEVAAKEADVPAGVTSDVVGGVRADEAASRGDRGEHRRDEACGRKANMSSLGTVGVGGEAGEVVDGTC